MLEGGVMLEEGGRLGRSEEIIRLGREMVVKVRRRGCSRQCALSTWKKKKPKSARNVPKVIPGQGICIVRSTKRQEKAVWATSQSW